MSHILIGIYRRMEADCFSRQLVNFYQTIWTHIPEDNDNIGFKSELSPSLSVQPTIQPTLSSTIIPDGV